VPRQVHHLSLSALLLVSACMTPSEKRDMQNDMFNVQTRLLNLEQSLTDTSKKAETTGDSAAKRLASTSTQLDKMARDIQQVRGEMDALRIGVVTGQMPGSSPEDGSVAQTLTQIGERLDAIEQAQQELLDALAKSGVKKPAVAKKTGGGAKGAEDLQKAFDAKRYKQVAEDAPRLLKAGGGGKEQISFLYAESLFKLGKLRDAALKYNDFIESKPSAKYLPLAKMRIGDCFRHLGDGVTAKLYYEELVKEFPDTEEAARAKERLAEVKS
jgi:hypothetical protein